MKNKVCVVLALVITILAIMCNASLAVPTGEYEDVGKTLGGGDMISKAGRLRF